MFDLIFDDMKRLTKEAMVKDIFFLVTNGKRNKDNYVDGMWLIETVARTNWAWAIKDWWNQVVQDPDHAEKVWNKMIDMTYINTSGVNGYTPTSKKVMDVYWMFK